MRQNTEYSRLRRPAEAGTQSTDKKSPGSGFCALCSEKGIALVMVLVLSGIALAIMTGLLYMLTAKTQFSGMHKRYKTALEAGKGGADITYQIIEFRGDPIETENFLDDLREAGRNPDITTPVTCVPLINPLCPDIGDFRRVATKLNLPTSCWSAECDSSLTIDPAIATTYDVQFDVGADPVYTVYSKIADNAGMGNSGSDVDLEAEGVVSSSSLIATKSVPYLYTVEIDAQNAVNPAERAKLSILYQY